MTIFSKIRTIAHQVRGAAYAEYIVVILGIVFAMVAFVSASSGVLSQGVNLITEDLSDSGSIALSEEDVEVAKFSQEFSLYPSSLPHASVGDFYQFDFKETLFAPSGTSSSNLVFSVASGNLPTGFSLSQNGVLSGVYSGSGQPKRFAFEVQVTHAGAISLAQYSLVVQEQGLYLAPADIPTVNLEKYYRLDLADLTGYPAGLGPKDVTWSLSSGVLPDGLFLENGEVRGLFTGKSKIYVGVLGVSAPGFSDTQEYQFQTDAK